MLSASKIAPLTDYFSGVIITEDYAASIKAPFDHRIIFFVLKKTPFGAGIIFEGCLY